MYLAKQTLGMLLAIGLIILAVSAKDRLLDSHLDVSNAPAGGHIVPDKSNHAFKVTSILREHPDLPSVNICVVTGYSPWDKNKDYPVRELALVDKSIIQGDSVAVDRNEAYHEESRNSVDGYGVSIKHPTRYFTARKVE